LAESSETDAVVVFLLLGAMWAVVLVPPWIQSRREARPIASMMTFRSQLWSLRRATPDYGLDSYRWYGDDQDEYDDDYDDDVDSEDAEVHALDPQVGAAVAVAATAAGTAGGVGFGPAVGSRPLPLVALDRRAELAPAYASDRRAVSYRRRRRTLGALLLLNLAGLAPMILYGGVYTYLAAGAGALLAVYFGLLVRRGRREAERSRKVRYLTPIRAPRPAVVVIGSGAAR
jgi:hypothetical protein